METVANRFKIVTKLGEGSFSQVYKALDTQSGKHVALKVDSVSKDDSMLWKEYKIYMWLHAAESGELYGIPKPIYYEEIKSGNAMAMPLVGESLDKLLIKMNDRFSLKTVLLLTIQLSRSLEFLHRHKFVHRDLKPANMARAYSDKDPSRIYLLDYGLSTRFIQPDDKPLDYRTDLKFVGTCRYCPKAAHEGFSQSANSELESLIYIMVYFMQGTLPWKGKKKQTLQLKSQWQPPGIWKPVWQIAKSTVYGDMVDWDKVRSWATELMEDMGYSDDGIFDWELD